MADNYNSLGDILKYFMKLQKYSTSILTKINEAVNTDADNVTISIENDNGIKYNYKIPSFRNLERRIRELDRQIKTNSVGKQPTHTDSNGIKLAVEPITIGELDVPVEFFSKPNYFIENMLNPLLFIRVDVSNYVPMESNQILSRRVILTIDSEDKRQIFIKNFDKKKDIDHKNAIDLLNQSGIKYQYDDELLELPPIQLKYNGTFSVIKIGDELLASNEYSTKRRYYLNKLTYEEIIDNNISTVYLKPNDIIANTVGDSFFRVLNVNQEDVSIELGLETGYDVIPIQTNVLRVASPLEGRKMFEVTIGPNEYQIIFLKSVDHINHIISPRWSQGFAFKSEDLSIKTEEGVVNFMDFYKQKVYDFAKLLDGISKEMIRPSTQITKPNKPILDPQNFKVFILNTQTKDENDFNRKKDLLDRRTSLYNKKNEYSTYIDKDKKVIEEDRSLSVEERDALIVRIDTYTKLKTTVVNELDKVIDELLVENKDIATRNLYKPKTVIQGAWSIPEPIDSGNGKEHITHFRIKVTYLDKDGNPPSNTFVNLKNSDGSVEPCYFPNFKIIETPRRNVIKQVDNTYIFETPDISNPSGASINKLPEPISIDVSSGEKIKLQVQSCIESLGLSNQDTSSDWSDPIIISSPPEMSLSFVQEQKMYENIKFYADIDIRNRELDRLVLNQEKLTSQIALLNQLVNNTGMNYQPVSTYVINSVDLANKFILLPYMPASYMSLLIFIGSSKGVHGIDYVLMGQRIDWGGLGFESDIQEGTVIEVINLGTHPNLNVGVSS